VVTGRDRLFITALLATISVFLVVPIEARAGPPLLTGDTGTPGPGRWEVNVGFTVEKRPGETVYETPILDMNYGIGERVQLNLVIPWLVLSSKGEKTKNGLGNSSAGVKWRFLNEATQHVSVSVSPQVEFNNPGSSSADRGLVDKGTIFLLPLQFGKTWGLFGVTAELGYAFKEHLTDEWSYGFAASYAVTDWLELLAEIHGTALGAFDKDEIVFNVGTRWKLSQHYVLLASAGRAICSPEGEEAKFLSYLGIQFLF
jgi:hypothetical protein